MTQLYSQISCEEYAAGVSSKTARGYSNKLVDEGILDAIGTKNSPKRRYRINR